MKQPCVLMLAYHFPPEVAAASFRALRFVKYLPEYGWRPIVISTDPRQALESHNTPTCDPELESQVPKATVVARTAVPFPVDRLDEWLAACLPRRRTFHTTDESPDLPVIRRNSRPWARPITGFIRGLLRNFRDLVLTTPDPYVHWRRPAFAPPDP